MKTTVVATLLALLPALGSSIPITSRQTSGGFTMIAIHSGNQYVHNQPINANGGLFWIGRASSSSCPASVVNCPATDATVLDYYPDSTGISTSHEVPGEQAVYIQPASASTPGALTFNAPHSSPPTGSILDGFTLTGTNLVFESTSWWACPAMGAYFVVAVADGAEPQQGNCIGINIHTFPYTLPEPAVWEYN